MAPWGSLPYLLHGFGGQYLWLSRVTLAVGAAGKGGGHG